MKVNKTLFIMISIISFVLIALRLKGDNLSTIAIGLLILLANYVLLEKAENNSNNNQQGNNNHSELG